MRMHCIVSTLNRLFPDGGRFICERVRFNAVSDLQQPPVQGMNALPLRHQCGYVVLKHAKRESPKEA